MRHCTPRRGLVIGSLSFCGALILAAVAFGQRAAPALPASLQRSEATESEQRAALRQELDAQARVLQAQSSVLRIVAKLIGPAVVHIEADIPPEAVAPSGRSRHVEEAGSGVIIQRNGKFYVLTNKHVIRNAGIEAIKINLADGRRINPSDVLGDRESDVAVLPVSAPDLVAAPLGDSDKLDIGDFVLAAGSPFGLSHSITFGIISAKGRRALTLGETDSVEFQDFLQTDAAINPGNSGGPLVNLHGEVIGINTAIASNSGGNEGIGFAIPVKMFMTIAEQLIDKGHVTRALLGVTMKKKSEYGPAMAAELGLPRPMGAYVNYVVPKSPADIVQLRPGDVILQFDNTAVEDDAHLKNLVSLTEVGKQVRLVILRDRKALTLTVEVGDASKFSK